MNSTTPAAPTCDMTKDCAKPITHLDESGFVYCDFHGPERRPWKRCRKLRSHELRRIMNGQTIDRY